LRRGAYGEAAGLIVFLQKTNTAAAMTVV